MAYVIIDTCTKDNLCVEACPVDCIKPLEDDDDYEEVEQLFIHPEECIDCGACIPVCPTESIYVLEETPDDKQEFIEKNAAYFGL
jgi:ferredoxin